MTHRHKHDCHFTRRDDTPVYRSDNMTHTHDICLAKIFADAKHACLIVKNYDSPTEHTSCKIFADAKHACLIIKTTTPLLNVHSANILCNAKCDMPSSDRGPLADQAGVDVDDVPYYSTVW